MFTWLNRGVIAFYIFCFQMRPYKLACHCPSALLRCCLVSHVCNEILIINYFIFINTTYKLETSMNVCIWVTLHKFLVINIFSGCVSVVGVGRCVISCNNVVYCCRTTLHAITEVPTYILNETGSILNTYSDVQVYICICSACCIFEQARPNANVSKIKWNFY